MGQTELINDLYTEENIIGTLLTNGDTINDVADILTPDSFTTPAFREIYAAMMTISDRGDAIDMLSVWNELTKKGSHVTEADLVNYSVEPATLEDPQSMALRLHDLERRRALWHLGNVIIVQSNGTEAVDVEDIHEYIRKFLENSNDKAQVTTLETAVGLLHERIERNRSSERLIGTPTGFPMLDETGGLHSGDLIIVAGSTSQGKTSFALSVTLNAIEQDCKVAYYSLEMDMVELSARLTSMRSGVMASRVMYHKLETWDVEKVNAATEALPLHNLFFDDRATSKLETILSSIRTMKKKHDIQGAVIDYLQILNINNSSRESQEQLMAYAARRMKNLAKELGVWIMALSQLNRGANRESDEPTLSRLRNSGQIAEAADIVLLVYRPEVYGVNYVGEFASVPTHNTAQINLAKGRNIGIGKFICSFTPEITLFKDAPEYNKKGARMTDTPKYNDNDNLPF